MYRLVLYIEIGVFSPLAIREIAIITIHGMFLFQNFPKFKISKNCKILYSTNKIGQVYSYIRENLSNSSLVSSVSYLFFLKIIGIRTLSVLSLT